MKKHLFYIALAIVALLTFNSCEGCVRKTTKKATKIGISAVEGITEAIDEKGESLAEKATDAAGKVAVGVGRSLDKQLDEHASTVASVAGRSTVQMLDSFVGGLSEEMKDHYIEIPHTMDFVSGVSLDYFAKYKSSPVIYAYFIMPEAGKYLIKFDCYDQQNKSFLTKDITVERTLEEKNKKYTLVNFALNQEEATAFENVKNVKIIVTKGKS